MDDYGYTNSDVDVIILYQDDDIIAANKPSGLLSIPDGYDRSLPHLAGYVEERFGRIWVVHRLDKDTSGIVLLARSAEAHRSLNLQFESRQVSKLYHALVTGVPTWDVIGLDLPVRTNVGRRGRTVVDYDHGKTAATEISVLSRFERTTLVSARPRTGYTHQIRAHLYAAGYPIMFDPLYGDPNAATLQTEQPRLALHAFTIEFTHPRSGLIMTFQAPYPTDFQHILRAAQEEI